MPESSSPSITLRVPADESSAALVGSATVTALRSAGLGDMEATEARCVIEALCLDAVHRCAEGPDPDPMIEFRINRVPGAVELVLNDQGLPIASNRTAVRRARQLASIGFVDHLSLVPVSPDGPTSTVTVSLPPEVLHPALGDADRAASDGAASDGAASDGAASDGAAGSDGFDGSDGMEPDAAEDIPFTVRTMVPGDSGAYARLVFRCYGYDYKRAAYEPEGVDEGLASGMHLAAIAEDPDGEMIGHVAYRRLRAGGSVVEGGAGMVDPRFRNRGVLKDMGAHLHEGIGALQVTGILSEPVMVHMATQRMAHIIGYDTGVFLRYSNPRLVAGFDTQDKTDRVSVLCSFIPLAPLAERSIHPPVSVHDYVVAVVDQGGLPRTVLGPTEPDGDSAPTELSTHADTGAGVARIDVRRVGPDLLDQVGLVLEDLVAAGAPVIHLDLPANDPSTGWHSTGIGQLGFVFCALLPECGEDGDVLRLQYLADTEIDVADWQIDLPATADLVHRVIGDLHQWEKGEVDARHERVRTWRDSMLLAD